MSQRDQIVRLVARFSRAVGQTSQGSGALGRQQRGDGFGPVGGDEEVPFEARVVTATNRDLETEVEEKRFRAELFYRINVVAIPVPGAPRKTSEP